MKGVFNSSDEIFWTTPWTLLMKNYKNELNLRDLRAVEEPSENIKIDPVNDINYASIEFNILR